MRIKHAVGETYVLDHPENVCFGCSPSNSRGLHLVFKRVEENAVEIAYTAVGELCGAPGVIHGGIQAVLIDEAMGNASHSCFEDDDPSVVTVEFSLRYRRPALAHVPLLIRAEIVRTEGRNVWLEGEIRSEQGEVLTTAEARWRRID